MSDANGIKSYRDLLVWQKGMSLAKLVYAMTGCFPASERFGLMAQMRRAAVSVPSNIAEGQARPGKKEFVQFLSHSEGSLAELDTQLTLATQLCFCHDPEASQCAAMIAERRKMLATLRRKIADRMSN